MCPLPEYLGCEFKGMFQIRCNSSYINNSFCISEEKKKEKKSVCGGDITNKYNKSNIIFKRFICLFIISPIINKYKKKQFIKYANIVQSISIIFTDYNKTCAYLFKLVYKDELLLKKKK